MGKNTTNDPVAGVRSGASDLNNALRGGGRSGYSTSGGRRRGAYDKDGNFIEGSEPAPAPPRPRARKPRPGEVYDNGRLVRTMTGTSNRNR